VLASNKIFLRQDLYTQYVDKSYTISMELVCFFMGQAKNLNLSLREARQPLLNNALLFNNLFLKNSSNVSLLFKKQTVVAVFVIHGEQMMAHKPVFNFIVLRKEDIKKVVNHPKHIRDQIIIDLSRLQGFRTREIATLRWSHINFEDGSIWVFDSKKHVFIPLPLDWRLAQLLSKYKAEVEPSEDDFVVQGTKNVSNPNKPISNQAIEHIVKQRAKEAGVFNWDHYNPTLFRAYFAAIWIRAEPRRSLKMLQVFMRHNDLPTTMWYVGRIVFWKEIAEEFDRFQQIPIEMKIEKEA
jgi:integrase